ncbi:MAG: alginate export family protein [Dissulfurispiraceae bacterium]|nr:alginate export family protein [Dissulfurispiraceae bacterium]
MAKRFVVFVSILIFASFFAVEVSAEVKFDAGATLRLRQEIWDNVVTLGTGKTQPDRNFFRFRTSVWGKASFSEQAALYLKLTNEAKYYTGPFKFNNGQDRLDEDEIIFDNLYLDLKKLFGGAVDLRIGRQDFIGPTGYGEGFIILEGTPGDGSRSFYFNAAKATVRFHKDHSVDLIYISDPKDDRYLPSAYAANKKQLTGSDEAGFVVYGKSKLSDSLTLEPYYVYKTEDALGSYSRLKLNTLGLRAAYKNNGWHIRGEYARQFGEYTGGMDRKGEGGYITIGRKYDKAALKPEFNIGYVYLSGDDPSTPNKNEAWNPLFSRVPMWNELIVYTLIPETGDMGGPIPAYWTNLHILRADIQLSLSNATSVKLGYNYLLADEKTSGKDPAMFSNNDKGRGHLPMAFVFHKFSSKLDGMIQAEYFIPGDFYASTTKSALFFRWQLQYKL